MLIGASVGPFAQAGLNEAFGFAVSAWCVGTGKELAQAQSAHAVSEEL